MQTYSEIEKKILRCNMSNIARTVGCSLYYTSSVLKGRVLRDTKTTRAIHAKASEILNVLSVSEMT
jgi:hypothetical protein